MFETSDEDDDRGREDRSEAGGRGGGDDFHDGDAINADDAPGHHDIPDDAFEDDQLDDSGVDVGIYPDMPQAPEDDWTSPGDGVLSSTGPHDGRWAEAMSEPRDGASEARLPKLGEWADGLLDGLTQSAAESVVWHTAALVANAFAPAFGAVSVQAACWTFGVVRALHSFNEGRGFVVPIQLAGIGGYDLEVGFRLCEEHPPPFPSLGPQVSWELNDIPIPDWLQLDQAEPVRFVGVTADEPRRPPAYPGYDIETLVRYAAERAYETGYVGGESWTPLVVAYLRTIRRAGLLILQSRAGEPPRVLSFEVGRPRRRRRRADRHSSEPAAGPETAM